MTTKTNVKLKETILQLFFLLAASAILFPNLCQLCQISCGREGRASTIRRHLIEHTGKALPILAALPLAQTNRLQMTGIKGSN